MQPLGSALSSVVSSPPPLCSTAMELCEIIISLSYITQNECPTFGPATIIAPAVKPNVERNPNPNPNPNPNSNLNPHPPPN